MRSPRTQTRQKPDLWRPYGNTSPEQAELFNKDFLSARIRTSGERQGFPRQTFRGCARFARTPLRSTMATSLHAEVKRLAILLAVDAGHVVPPELPQPLDRRPVTEGAMSSPVVVALEPTGEGRGPLR
jgi:predicted phage gp36 major capsid-like protein